MAPWLSVDAVKEDYVTWFATDRGRSLARRVCIALATGTLLGALIILGSSFKRIESREYGVAYDTVRRVVSDEVMSDGLHPGPPFFEFVKWPSTFVTVNMPEDLSEEGDSTCVSQDGLVVETKVSFQYIVDKMLIPETMRQFRDFQLFNEMIKDAGVSAVHHGCGDFRINEFQASRSQVQARMLRYFKEKVEPNAETGSNGLYARAIDLQLRNVKLPTAYAEAVAAKQSAEEDIALAQNQRVQQLTAAQTELLTAQREAQKLLDGARTTAQIRLRESEFRVNITMTQYTTEAETYRTIKEELALSNEGFLAYLGNRAVEQSSSPNLRILEPAKMSYREDLDL